MSESATTSDPWAWRFETPGTAGWSGSPRREAPNKYFMVSADGHANEPANLWHERMDEAFASRLPRMEKGVDGATFQVSEGFRPMRLRNVVYEGEDLERNRAGKTPEERLRDHLRDGIDAEIIFPNKGLAMWATPDAAFAGAMCRCWNDWAWETFGPYNDRLAPMGCVATGDLNGRDPRTARGKGGAVINYAVHSLSPTIEPVANMCASGVIERFPKLRFGTIEAGIGWIPWALQAMDEAYKKHHMWVRPKLKNLPSDSFRASGFASFQEDAAGLALAREHDLVGNFMWANDYPHHEGTWPHSAEAIERTMGLLDEGERMQILGGNAARVFGFPERRLARSELS